MRTTIMHVILTTLLRSVPFRLNGTPLIGYLLIRLLTFLMKLVYIYTLITRWPSSKPKRPKNRPYIMI